MRRRVLTATMAAVAVAVLLLGLPMSIFGALMVRQSLASTLTQRTVSITRAIDSRLDQGLEIDEASLQRWVEYDSDLPVRITVTQPDGTVVVAGIDLPEDEKQRFTVNQAPSPGGAAVTVEIAASTMFWRGAQVVILVVLASVVAFGVAALVASRQARRLAAPLIYLAASAEQLGSGQVRPRIERSGVEEIDLVAAELVRSGERMAARLASEREFAANASHQLRTPLTALSMRLEEIQLISTDPQVVEEATISLDQVERLVGVVDDLLSSSRQSEGGTTEAVRLRQVFAQQDLEWGPTYAKAGRELVFVPPGQTAVLATPGALTQALATLIENSLKYGDGTTTVRVRDSKKSEVKDSKDSKDGKGEGSQSVVIEVADEGKGVSDEIAGRIFERHVTSGKGSGLGLGLARDLVAADGGRLELAQRRPPVFAIFLNALPERLNPDEVLPPGSMVVVGRRRRRR